MTSTVTHLNGSQTRLSRNLIKLQIVLLIFFIPLGAFIDGTVFTFYFPNSQWLDNLLITLFVTWMYQLSDKKIQRKMQVMLLLSVIVEYLGTSVLKLYAYRLHNIPIYVPIAHTAFFATICHVQKWTIIRRHSQWLKIILFSLVTLICTLSLLLHNDVGGGVCYLIFIAILYKRNSKLYYLLMAVLVLYAERWGTSTHAWAWSTSFGIPPYTIPTGNPPIGVMGLYALHDFVANNVYFWTYLITKKRSPSGFCGSYACFKTYILQLLNQTIASIDLMISLFFGFNSQPTVVLCLNIMYNFLSNKIYFWRKVMRKKRPSNTRDNSAQVKVQVIAVINQFLKLIDLLLAIGFEKWGYKPFSNQITLPVDKTEDTSIVPLGHSTEDILKNIATLRASFLHSLDDIEKQLTVSPKQSTPFVQHNPPYIEEIF